MKDNPTKEQKLKGQVTSLKMSNAHVLLQDMVTPEGT